MLQRAKNRGLSDFDFAERSSPSHDFALLRAVLLNLYAILPLSFALTFRCFRGKLCQAMRTKFNLQSTND